MIFVFGSNLAGIHGAGAALTAAKYHGAIAGQGYGLQGNSFAIPTKDESIQTLPLENIEMTAASFRYFAEEHPELAFQITRVGCGLAGYTNEQMAPMFKDCPKNNCFFDAKWRPYLGKDFEYWGTF